MFWEFPDGPGITWPDLAAERLKQKSLGDYFPGLF